MIPILIHPRLEFEHAASPNRNIRIINAEKLKELKKAIKVFITSCVHSGQIADINKIKRLITENKLEPDLIKEYFSVPVSV